MNESLSGSNISVLTPEHFASNQLMVDPRTCFSPAMQARTLTRITIFTSIRSAQQLPRCVATRKKERRSYLWTTS